MLAMVTMNGGLAPHNLGADAAATRDGAAREVSRADGSLSAAVAMTQPVGIAPARRQFAQDHQFAEALPRMVKMSHHANNSTVMLA